jgi:hypothetical protein
MSATKFRRRRSKGSVLAVVTFSSVAVAALSFAMLTGSTNLYKGARARVESAKTYYVAEGGLDWTLSQLSNDPYAALHDTTRFPTVNSDGSYSTGWIPMGTNAGEFKTTVAYASVNSVPSSWTGTGFPSGFTPFTNLTINDRTSSPAFDRFIVSVQGRYNGLERASRAVVKTEFKAYGAALVCDAAPTDPTTGATGLELAQSAQAVVFEGTRQYVFGGLSSNGAVYRGTTAVTADNVATAMPDFHGKLAANLYDTAMELPDYTAPGNAQQAFDFGTFRSAAQAGKGSYYSSLSSFITAMNLANVAGTPLEGVVFVDVNANTEGSRAKITATGVPGGINVKGTLCLHVINAPDDDWRVSIETPLNVNKATYASNFDPANASTFTTGYPGTITAAKDPHTYSGFKAGDDLPAVMIDNGALEIMRAANVCGAIYAPSFLRIENTLDEKQFFNGALVAGAGVYVDGGSSSATTGSQTIAFDPFSIDDLATWSRLGKAPILAGYVIDR